MPKGLVTQLQGKQQLCIHMLYESLVGQCEYTTQPKGSFWCQFVDAKGLLQLLLWQYSSIGKNQTQTRTITRKV